MWLADKPRVQEHLSDKLAGLVSRCADLDQGVAMWYIGAFWHVMAKEWVGVDRLRCVSPLISCPLINQDESLIGLNPAESTSSTF